MNTIAARRETLWARLQSVEQMIAQRQGDSLLMKSARRGLEQQRLSLLAELEALEAQALLQPVRAHVQMTFRGDAVVGSEGIEAGFAGQVARQYPRLVRAMRRNKAPRSRAVTPRSPEPRLLLTGTARGSFGLVFEEEALESEQMSLLVEITSAESALDVFLSQTTAVREPLKGLLSACKDAGVSMRISSSAEARGWSELDASKIREAAALIAEAAVSSELHRVSGVLVGLHPLGTMKSFLMRLDDHGLIEGTSALDGDEEEALELMKRFGGQQCWAAVMTTQLERHGKREERHVLLDVAASEHELELIEEEASG
jgi:hypothetical protein